MNLDETPRLTTHKNTESNDSLWTVRMGDLRWKVVARSYEHAVAEFESMLIARGIERRGAIFDRQPLTFDRQPLADPVGASDEPTPRGRSEARGV